MSKKHITSFTVTCSRPMNYGAVLQTYGLNMTLTKLGIDAKVIDYDPDYYYKSSQPFPKRLIRNIVRYPDWRKGKKVFGKFLEDFVPMSDKTYHSLTEIEDDVPLADVYIAGSDQIWNCKNKVNGKDDTFFLTFAPESSRKISYAASISMPEIPTEQRSRYHNLISAFDAVSIREPSSIQLLNDIGIQNVVDVIDPALLLQQKDWDEIASKSSFVPKEDYVLIYGYNRQKDVYSYARKLAERLNVSIYTIGTAIEDYTLHQDRYFWNASPNTFVNLIKNAKAVVTNSFHGVVFSILYNKPFHFFTVKQTTNARMLDLLNSLNLSNRLVNESKILSNSIEYSVPNEILNVQREKSLRFLRTSLEIE